MKSPCQKLSILAVLASLTFLIATELPTGASAPTPLSPTWTKLSPTTSPPIREGASMVYDPAIRELVLFGGAWSLFGVMGINGYLDDTWTFNGTTWTQLSPANSPSAREGASMVYDPALGEVVLFGGEGSNGYLGDTWTFDGTTWTPLSPASSPGPRHLASAVYDPDTKGVVLYGGTVGIAYFNDTWSFNGKTWTRLSLTASPPSLYGASMAYDSGPGDIVLFGGVQVNQLADDTWTFNGKTWTRLVTNSPLARDYASMVDDPATGDIVLFGGGGSHGLLNDTWSFDGRTWTRLAPITSPPVRFDASMAYDSATGDVILFGGGSESSSLSDTWSYAQAVGAPGAPTGVTATSGNASATVAWTAPSSTGNSAIASYVVTPYVGTIAMATRTFNSTTTTETVTGLTPGTTYSFTVAAVNAAGTGAPSGHSNLVTVPKATTTTNFGLTAARLTYGHEQVDHLSVTVLSRYTGSRPTGTVTVNESTMTLCTIKLSSGRGSCTLSGNKLAVGSYSLVAAYSGSSVFLGSVSAKESLTVVK